MKTITRIQKMMLMLLFVVTLPVQTYAMDSSTEPINEPKTEMAARAEVLTQRLEEIKSIDRSNMTRAEKKALRKEVKSIKKELATTGGGVYLSVGAIILIVVLLIILL